MCWRPIQYLSENLAAFARLAGSLFLAGFNGVFLSTSPVTGGRIEWRQ